jgi:hypothetical protein
VNDNAAVVQQQPAGIGTAFLAVRLDAFIFQTFFDFVINCAELPLAFAGADYKVIRKAAQAANIQQYDIYGLSVTGCIYSPPG